MIRVLGVDLSLAYTGLGFGGVDAEGRVTLSVGRVKSKAPQGIAAGDELAATSLRLRGIVTQLWPHVQVCDLLVIEAPAYSSDTGKAHDRSGLWWMLVARATACGIPVAQIRSNTLKVYATGVGRGDKDEVLAQVVRRYPDVDVRGNNEADALILAAMGLHHLGHPYADLPQAHTRAMAAPSWPTTTKGADR